MFYKKMHQMFQKFTKFINWFYHPFYLEWRQYQDKVNIYLNFLNIKSTFYYRNQFFAIFDIKSYKAKMTKKCIV